MVLVNEYDNISVPFVKWHTFNLRGASLLTIVINELENNRSIVEISASAIREKYKTET